MSSKLSKRRATVRKPKICVAASCPPPPPPVPWPPETFEIQFQFTYDWEEGPVTVAWSVDVNAHEETPWFWEGSAEDPQRNASWEVNEEAHTAELICDGFDENFATYLARKGDIPVVWNSTVPYTIVAWDEFTPGMYNIRADFLF